VGFLGIVGDFEGDEFEGLLLFHVLEFVVEAFEEWEVLVAVEFDDAGGGAAGGTESFQGDGFVLFGAEDFQSGQEAFIGGGEGLGHDRKTTINWAELQSTQGTILFG